MKQTKRILALVLCVALIFALAACGKSKNSPPADLETVPYDTQTNGVIKVAVLRDASAIGLWQLFDNERYEIKITESFEEAQTLLSSGEADIAACPASAVTDDVQPVGVISNGTVSLTKASEDAGLTVKIDPVPTCFVAGKDTSGDLIAAFICDAQISAEKLNLDYEEAANQINEQKLFASDVSEDILRDCNIIFMTGEEMQTLLAQPYEAPTAPTETPSEAEGTADTSSTDEPTEAVSDTDVSEAPSESDAA